MNLKLIGLGAEPKKIGVLGLLVLVAVYFIFFSGPKEETAAVPAHPAASGPLPGVTAPVAHSNNRARKGQGHNLKEFRPSLKPKDGPPRDKIDPTLHIALLAKLQGVAPEGGRSLFDFGQTEMALNHPLIKEPPPIKPKTPFVGPVQPPPPAPPPPPPTAPPVPLKFYGWINPHQTTAPKRAFFLDGEEIIVVTEGETVKKRYKIVRIGLNSAVVEDTQFKTNNQQTLPLVEEQAGP
jgi:hypothetical protein